jgi:hypothetical protein
MGKEKMELQSKCHCSFNGRDEALTIGRTMRAVVEFCDARDWASFHDPKKLAPAHGIDAAELNEVFQ